MTSLFDLDITRTSRPSDYDLDVIIGGEWAASAKNFHAADEAAHETWYRATLEQPVICDTPAGNTDNECTINCPGCATCVGDPPGENPLGDTEGDPEDPGEWRAHTLQSIAIESRIKRCVNCNGAHFTWQCPETRTLLFTAHRSTCVSCGDPLSGSEEIACDACCEESESIAV